MKLKQTGHMRTEAMKFIVEDSMKYKNQCCNERTAVPVYCPEKRKVSMAICSREKSVAVVLYQLAEEDRENERMRERERERE